MALAFTLQYMDRRYATGVMVERQTTVHERPDPNSASVSTAYEGYTMRVDLKLSEQPETGDWSRVRLQNGVYGWVRSEERRVGKECRCGRETDEHRKEKGEEMVA